MERNDFLEFFEEFGKCKATMVLEISRTNSKVRDEVVVRTVIGDEYNYPEIQEAFPKYEEQLKEGGIVGKQSECLFFVKEMENSDVFYDYIDKIIMACNKFELNHLKEAGVELSRVDRAAIDKKYGDVEAMIKSMSHKLVRENMLKRIEGELGTVIYDNNWKKIINLQTKVVFDSNVEHSEGYRYVAKLHAVIM